ncbi:MAG: hypothetical protein PHV68_03510 [Candidatus Gastranaerophilales bacterium]|nr:hypothetical protein [Candidatus Gastranaerophilales bacterium]
MELSKNINFDTSIYENTNPLVKHTLTKVSTEEISQLINRINLYLEHFKILNKKKTCSREQDNKACILKRMKSILSCEIANRKQAIKT